jgi:hypothetical protein
VGMSPRRIGRVHTIRQDRQQRRPFSCDVSEWPHRSAACLVTLQRSCTYRCHVDPLLCRCLYTSVEGIRQDRRPRGPSSCDLSERPHRLPACLVTLQRSCTYRCHVDPLLCRCLYTSVEGIGENHPWVFMGWAEASSGALPGSVTWASRASNLYADGSTAST